MVKWIYVFTIDHLLIADMGNLFKPKPGRAPFGQPGRRCSVPIDSDSDSDRREFRREMMAQGVSKYCIFNEDFRYVFKCAVGAVVYKLR